MIVFTLGLVAGSLLTISFNVAVIAARLKRIADALETLARIG